MSVIKVGLAKYTELSEVDTMLDRIISDIEDIKDNVGIGNNRYVRMAEIYKVFDKYRAESEEEDSGKTTINHKCNNL